MIKRWDRLTQLPENAALDDIVRAWVLPTFTLPTTGDGRRGWQILQNALITPSPATVALLTEMTAPVQEHLIDRIARHVPDVPHAELWFRHTAVLAALGALGRGPFAAMLADVDPERLADQLVAWIVGGLTAHPAT